MFLKIVWKNSKKGFLETFPYTTEAWWKTSLYLIKVNLLINIHVTVFNANNQHFDGDKTWIQVMIIMNNSHFSQYFVEYFVPVSQLRIPPTERLEHEVNT